MKKKRKHPELKLQLHPRNKHRMRYDFEELTASYADLALYVRKNKYRDNSIDYFDPAAVKALNTALLYHYYGIKEWDIPAGYLCPPIPGRADYLHHIADLLSTDYTGKIPKGSAVKCLDVGVGASCIYPIIGAKEYGWSFIGSELDKVAFNSALHIIESNPFLKRNIEIRIQSQSDAIFKNVIQPDEMFDIIISNPPFHNSQKEAQEAALRKLNTLKEKNQNELILSFGGQETELWCEGGERKFVSNMILESRVFGDSCLWFSSLVSKEESLKAILFTLEKSKVAEMRTIHMGQGNKTSRIIAWTFLSQTQRNKWAKIRWS